MQANYVIIELGCALELRWQLYTTSDQGSVQQAGNKTAERKRKGYKSLACKVKVYGVH